jgi:hypothetical protein
MFVLLGMIITLCVIGYCALWVGMGVFLGGATLLEKATDGIRVPVLPEPDYGTCNNCDRPLDSSGECHATWTCSL